MPVHPILRLDRISSAGRGGPRLLSLSPADNATDVPVDANLVITFDKTVVAGASFTFELRETGDDSLIESIDETDIGTLVSISGPEVTINPASNFDGSLGVYALLAAGSVKDEAGRPFAGISSKTMWNFTTAAADAFPDNNTGASEYQLLFAA